MAAMSNASLENYAIVSGLETWSFCGQVVKILPFSEVICPQIFVWPFILLKMWPNVHVPTFRNLNTQNVSMYILSKAHFLS